MGTIDVLGEKGGGGEGDGKWREFASVVGVVVSFM